jgi:hypothetical protein
MMFTQAILALVLLGHASAAWAVPLLVLHGATLSSRDGMREP